jgi:hypothetical protein
MTQTRTCSKCHKDLPEPEFYAENITGWSKICKGCRKRNIWRVDKRRVRSKLEMMAKADVEMSMLKTTNLNGKLKQLIREFKRFTLPNRNRLKELEKKAANSPRINERTRNAIATRRLNQEKAEALLQYQVSVVTLGLKTHHISDLWRERYGDDT